MLQRENHPYKPTRQLKFSLSKKENYLIQMLVILSPYVLFTIAHMYLKEFRF